MDFQTNEEWLCCNFTRHENRELVLQSFYQNYGHFQQKLYKGCEFKTGTEVKKFEIGKRGIARGYKSIETDSKTNSESKNE